MAYTLLLTMPKKYCVEFEKDDDDLKSILKDIAENREDINSMDYSMGDFCLYDPDAWQTIIDELEDKELFELEDKLAKRAGVR